MIPLQVAIDEGLLVFVPESKSPHGVDLAPGGEYVTVSGKLDPHVSVYSVAKIKKAISEKRFEGKDAFGVPILKYDDCLEAHVPTGLGPLHTVFDEAGHRVHLPLPRLAGRQVGLLRGQGARQAVRCTITSAT